MDLSKLKKWSSNPPGDKPGELPAGQNAVDAPIAHPLPPEPVVPALEPVRPSRMPDYAPAAPVTAGFGVFLSLILGVVFMFLGQRFAQWGLATMAGKEFNTNTTWMTGPNAGQPVPYWEIAGFAAWSEMGIFTMGVALLVDALVMFVATRGARPNTLLMMFAFAVTGIALATNIGLCAKQMIGPNAVLPIMSLIAVIAGSFILFDHWAVWQENRAVRRPA